MADDSGVVEKVAARLTLDISAGQQKLVEFGQNFDQFASQAASSYELVGRAQLDMLTQSGAQYQQLSSAQQARILQIEQDGELKRQMAMAAFQQASLQAEEEFNAKMEAMDEEAQAAREAMTQAAILQTLAVVSQADAQKQSLLEQSALKQQALNDKIYQAQEAHEERMAKLKLQTERQQSINDQASLRQPSSMDQLMYQAQQEDQQRFLTAKKASDKEYTQWWSDTLKQEEMLDKAHYQALQSDRDRDLKLQEQNVNDKLQQIKTFYEIGYTTAQGSAKQIEALMNEESDFFQQNLDKRLQALKLFYKMQNDAAAQNNSTAPAGQSTESQLSSSLLGSAASTATHVAAGIASFAVLDQLQKVPQLFEDISASVTKLKQVLELSPQINSVQQLNDNVSQLQGVAEQMAVIYGQNVTQVLDVMTEAGRRFKDVPSIIVATDNALQAMAADNVDATTAIKGEEAIMSQFQLSLSQTKDTWAKLTVAAHEFQANTSDIINGLERSGSAFDGMKVSTDGAIAAIVALEQESGRTGQVVGTTWKSIENTLASKKGVEALQELGIQAKTSNGQLTDGLTVLGDLQKKWPQLSESARTAFANILAGGKQQYGMLLTFLDNTSGTYTRALDAMKNATVQTQQELVNSALQSLPAQMQMTSAQIQVMAADFSDLATPAMMKFFQELRTGSGYIGDHAQAIEKLISTGMKFAEAYVAWKVGLQLYTAATESATIQNAALQTSLLKLEVQSGGVVQGLKLISGAILDVAGAAAATVAKVAALVAVVNLLNTQAQRASDPLTAKEGDLQAQLAELQKEKSSVQNQSVWSVIGSSASTSWDAMKDIWNGDPARATQRMQAMWSGNANVDSINTQIDNIKHELNDVQAQKAEQDKAQQDQYQKMIDDAMKAAGDNHPTPPPMGNGPDNITPGSSKAQSAAAYTQPFADSVKAMQDNLGPLDDITKSLDTTLSTLTYHQDELSNSLKFGSTNAQIASDAFQVYSQRMSANKAQQDALHATNDQIRSDLVNLAEQMHAINPNNLDPTKLSQGQQDSLSKLSQEYNTLSSQMDANSKKWQDDVKSIISASDDWLNSVYQLQANGLKPLGDALKDLQNDIKVTKAQMSLDDSEMQHGDTSFATITDYAKNYLAQQKDLTAEEKNFAQQIAMTKQNINDLQYTLNTLDTSSVAYDSEVSSLTQKINDDKAALADYTDQLSQTQIAAQQLADTLENQVVAGLKAGYDAEQKFQDAQLKNQYDTQIEGLTDQKNAVDQLIKSLQEQWQVQDANEKLTDLQTQDSQIKSTLDHVIVNTDGTVSRTYDTQKALDVEQQIADQQTQISRDQQKQALQDQSDAIGQQIQQDQDAYNQQKQNLDDYWSYRTDQDQLKQQADQLIIQSGYKTAILNAQQFAGQMQAIYNSITMPGINAGETVAKSLPGGLVNAGSTSQSLQSIIQTADQQWQQASTQAQKDAIHQALANQLAGSGAVFNNQTGEWSLNGTILNGSQAQPTVGQALKAASAANGPVVNASLNTPSVYSPQLAASAAQNSVSNTSTTTVVQKGGNTINVTVNASDQNDVHNLLDLLQSV